MEYGEFRENAQRFIEELVSRNLIDLYTTVASGTADTTETMSGLMSAREFSSHTQELIAGMQRELLDILEDTGDEIIRNAEKRMIEQIPDVRKRIQVKHDALLAAKKIWENKLGEPDQSHTVIQVGDKRLTLIEAELATLPPVE